MEAPLTTLRQAYDQVRALLPEVELFDALERPRHRHRIRRQAGAPQPSSNLERRHTSWLYAGLRT